MRRIGGVVCSSRHTGQFLRLVVNYEGEAAELAAALLDTDGVALHSIGRASEVIKDVGTPVNMDQRHAIGAIRGTHGIGHVRMATESRVDVNHAHPFWAYPFPDVSVVHNGQLTNYHKLRRSYEDRGHHFQTGNDSELIAVYLADKLAHGEGLDDALRASLSDLDGTFTYLVATLRGPWLCQGRVVGQTAGDHGNRRCHSDRIRGNRPARHPELQRWPGRRSTERNLKKARL